MRFSFAFLFLTALLITETIPYQIGFSQDKDKDKASPIASIESESELIGILNSDSPGGDKALACKRLAIYGSGTAAPALANLLTDEKLASWSRIALEAIPGKEADEALRGAMSGLSGRLLVGVINSIGARADRGSVEKLIEKLKDQDEEVVGAAAVALGKIGGKPAAEALRKSLAIATGNVRSFIAEGCELCAEKFLAEGNAALAIEIYDEVRKADLPTQRIVEATRGAILARKQEGIPLLLEQLRSDDKAMFYLGLWVARELPGKEVAAALLAELKKATPERAAMIVQALADRTETLDLPTILQVASSGPKEVRIAAMSAISRVGDASCVAPLLAFALEKDADLLLPAKAALTEIQDEGVSKEIIERLPSASGDMQKLLIEVIGQRRIEATAQLVKALESSNQAIRNAALESLGSTIPQDRLSILIAQVVSPKNPEDAARARQALETAAIRMPDREACAAELAAAVSNASVATKTSLLEILGAVGGSKALEAVRTAAKNADPQMKDVGSRLLGDWMTIDAAPVLLELATTGPLDKYQVRAMRGYIRIARQFAMSEKARIEMCAKALDAAKQSAEQKLVIEILPRFPNIETLKLAIKALENPEVKAEATQAAQAIAQKLGDKKEVNELMSNAGIAKP